MLSRIEQLVRYGFQPSLPRICLSLDCIRFVLRGYLCEAFPCVYHYAVNLLPGCSFFAVSHECSEETSGGFDVPHVSSFSLPVISAAHSVYSTSSPFPYLILHARERYFFIRVRAPRTRQLRCRKQWWLKRIGYSWHFLETWLRATGCLAYKTALHASQVTLTNHFYFICYFWDHLYFYSSESVTVSSYFVLGLQFSSTRYRHRLCTGRVPC